MNGRERSFCPNRSIRAANVPDAEPPLGFGDQCLDLFPRHRGKIVDVKMTMTAKAHLLIARHLIPASLTW